MKECLLEKRQTIPSSNYMATVTAIYCICFYINRALTLKQNKRYLKYGLSEVSEYDEFSVNLIKTCPVSGMSLIPKPGKFRECAGIPGNIKLSDTKSMTSVSR